MSRIYIYMCYVMLPDSRCAKGELGPGYVMGDGRWNISIRRQPQRLHNTLHLSLAVDKHTQTKRALHFLTNLLIECVCVSSCVENAPELMTLRKKLTVLVAPCEP